jgi:hypothetical protein
MAVPAPDGPHRRARPATRPATRRTEVVWIDVLT